MRDTLTKEGRQVKVVIGKKCRVQHDLVFGTSNIVVQVMMWTTKAGGC